jgi:hypothetical protein
VNKLYLPPSETRRYAVELPVGDPWSGPAFGKREMPVVAVALAATSFVSGVAAFTAATTIGGMIAAGATIVGSALTIIGTVTGNAKLAKIGGILSIGGMVGTGVVNSMADTAANAAAEGAAQAGAEGAAEAAGGSAINEAAHFSDAAFDAGMPGAASVPPRMAQNAAAGRGLIDAGMESAGPMTDVQSQAAVDAAKQTISPVDPAKPFADPGAQALNSAGAEVRQSLDIDPFANESAKLLRQNAAPPGSLLETSGGTSLGGYFDKFGRWVKDNKELAKMGAEFASGLFPSDKEKAMTEAYKQQTADARRRALWAQGKIA